MGHDLGPRAPDVPHLLLGEELELIAVPCAVSAAGPIASAAITQTRKRVTGRRESPTQRMYPRNEWVREGEATEGFGAAPADRHARWRPCRLRSSLRNPLDREAVYSVPKRTILIVDDEALRDMAAGQEIGPGRSKY